MEGRAIDYIFVDEDIEKEAVNSALFKIAQSHPVLGLYMCRDVITAGRVEHIYFLSKDEGIRQGDSQKSNPQRLNIDGIPDELFRSRPDRCDILSDYIVNYLDELQVDVGRELHPRDHRYLPDWLAVSLRSDNNY